MQIYTKPNTICPFVRLSKEGNTIFKCFVWFPRQMSLYYTTVCSSNTSVRCLESFFLWLLLRLVVWKLKKFPMMNIFLFYNSLCLFWKLFSLNELSLFLLFNYFFKNYFVHYFSFAWFFSLCILDILVLSSYLKLWTIQYHII